MDLFSKYTSYGKILRATEELLMTNEVSEAQRARFLQQRSYYSIEMNYIFTQLMEDKQGGNNHE